MNMNQGMLDVGDSPPPSLLEDPEIELGDLATVPYVDRGGDRQAAYDARRAARLERIRNAAERARVAADATLARARDMASVIPFGQPMMPDHYSYRSDRNYRDRIQRTYERSFKLAERAAELERRATNTTRAISSDDPSATAQLRQKLERLEQKQTDMKACNAIIRKHTAAGYGAQVLALAAYGHGMTEELAAKLLEPDFCGRIGFADYQITNNGAEVRRVKARIEALERTEARPVATGGGSNGVTWGEDRDMNRVWIEFPGKPDAGVRSELKRNGFRWAPSVGRWQRQTSNAALYHAQRIAS